MVIEKLPPDGENPEDPVVKKPEYIIIEDTSSTETEPDPFGGRQKYYQSFHQIEASKYPNGVRIFTFVAGLALFVFSFLALAALVIYFALALLTFFQVPTINRYLALSWAGYKTLLVFAFGSFIATISPAFGFGIILVYFAVQGRKLESSMLGKFFQQGMGRKF